jgi:putative ABC transport system substrate-binding protein
MKRREFIALLGGTASTFELTPFSAISQPAGMPIVAVLGGAISNADGLMRIRAFRESLRNLGRIDGSNVRLDIRLAGDDLASIRAHAAEFARTKPAAILAIGTPVLVALREATRTVPIVFANVSDPVDGGFVDSEARPGGNITGFTSFEYSLGSKWLEVLKEVRPSLARVLVLLNPDNYTSRGLLRSVQAAAPAIGVEVVAARISASSEIEPAFTAFTRQSNGGVIVTPDPLTVINLTQIIALSNQHRLPSIHAFRYLPASGGLLSYGTDITDIFQGAAAYVDRILKGNKLSDLPVQNPTRYRLVINLKTAKSIGLSIPESFLLRADEVIE